MCAKDLKTDPIVHSESDGSLLLTSDLEEVSLDLDENRWAVDVSDLKQYAYCPRVVYYRYRFPDFRPETYKMEAGRVAHRQVMKRWKRRLPRGLPAGEVRWEVPLYSPERRLAGRVDLLILTEDEAIVVDFKQGRRVRPNWKDQLAAYALLVEDVLGREVTPPRLA